MHGKKRKRGRVYCWDWGWGWDWGCSEAATGAEEDDGDEDEDEDEGVEGSLCLEGRAHSLGKVSFFLGSRSFNGMSANVSFVSYSNPKPNIS